MARPLLEELFYDPLGGWADGSSVGAIGGHSDHVHIALMRARAMLHAMQVARRRFGLHVGENPRFDPVDPVHTEGSWHYQTFRRHPNIGKAADISGDPAKMAAFTRWALRKYGGMSAADLPGGGAGRRPGRSSSRSAMPAIQPLNIGAPDLRFDDPRAVLARLAPRRAAGVAADTPTMGGSGAELLAELRRQLLGGL